MYIKNIEYTLSERNAMSFFCGTDIVEVDRIKKAISENARFKDEIFTKAEIDDIEKGENEEYKFQRYAGRFASKEALYKALSKILISEKLSPNFLDVEIINDDNLRRRPYVRITEERLDNLFRKYQIKVDLSISHIKENAIAVAIVNIEKE